MKNHTDDQTLIDVFDVLGDNESEDFLVQAKAKLTSLVHRVVGAKKAEIESAVPLTNDEKERISKLLKTIAGHEVKAYFRVKKSLLGGLRIAIGDWKLDGSLLYQLHAIKTHMIAE